MEDLWCNFMLCRTDQTIRELLAASDSLSRCAVACSPGGFASSPHSSGHPSLAVELHGGRMRRAAAGSTGSAWVLGSGRAQAGKGLSSCSCLRFPDSQRALGA